MAVSEQEIKRIHGEVVATGVSLDDYMAHMTHALSVCGEDHVGIGSDTLLTAFDTSPASMKAWDEDILLRRTRGIAAPGEGRPPFYANGKGMGLRIMSYRADRLGATFSIRRREPRGTIVNCYLPLVRETVS